MTALWLLAPQTPMLFQGQEFRASSRFLYFADNTGEQASRVAEGRAKFLQQFPSIAATQAQNGLPNPADRSTFERCKLNLAERQAHRETYDLHVDLLRLRHDDPVFRECRADRLDGATLGPDALMVRFFGDSRGDRLLLVNFGRDLNLSPVAQPLFAPQAGCTWRTLWSSCEPAYGGGGTPQLELKSGWHIPGEAAVVLQAVPQSVPTAAAGPASPAP
jgi:maltooligosyltrehalose trehalohydrolase